MQYSTLWFELFSLVFDQNVTIDVEEKRWREINRNSRWVGSSKKLGRPIYLVGMEFKQVGKRNYLMMSACLSEQIMCCAEEYSTEVKMNEGFFDSVFYLLCVSEITLYFEC